MAEQVRENDLAPTDQDRLKQFVGAAVREALKEFQGQSSQPAPIPAPAPAPNESIWVVIIGKITNPTIIISMVAFAATAALGFGLYQSGGRFLESLQHTEIARGLITFLIAMATVSIAIIISLYAVVSADSELVKERFPLAKEVLTLLIGILGTILGFYFGSADKAGASLDIGDIQVSSQQLYTRVAGGTKPYRYSVTSSDNEFQAQQGTSDDGWIIQPIQKSPKTGSTITIEVTDSKDLRVTKKRSIGQDGAQKLDSPGSPMAAPQSTSPSAGGPAPIASEPPK